MTDNYAFSNYITGNYSFECARSSTNLNRTLEGISTYIRFFAGNTLATKTIQWEIEGDIEVNRLIVFYTGSPSGTITINLINLDSETMNLTLNTNTVGEKFDNAWLYHWDDFIIPKGYKARLTPSVNIEGVNCFCKPVLLFDEHAGTIIN